MDPGIGIETDARRAASPDGGPESPPGEPPKGRRVARPRGTRSTADAPPAVHRPRDRRVRAARPTPNRALAGTSVRNRQSASVSSRIQESSTPVATGMPCSTIARQRSCRDPTPAMSCVALAPSCSRSRASTSLGRMRPDANLSRYRDSAEERLAAEPHRRLFDRLFERQVLERVQRVVVDEDADRPLRRQQVREAVDHAREWMIL